MKKLLSIVLSFLMVAVLLPIDLHTAKADDYSGKCGDHLSWVFDPDTGTLRISGVGPMYDYSIPDDQPWSSYREAILNISLPDGLSRVGQDAFWNCINLTSITIPDSVQIIGSYAFCGCSSLAQIVLPDHMEDIGSGAFCNCVSITAFSFPEGIRAARKSVLNGATALASVSFSSTVTYIESQAFEDCTSLFAITIPDTVTGIDYSAFYGCAGLTSIKIPDSVTFIGNQAFAGCTSLTSFAVPANTTVIPYGLLSGCRDLISFSMHASVTEIGSDAFSDCTGLTTINIPDSVQIIGRNAFSGCTGLQTIVLPNGIETIQKCTFENCTALTHVGIPDSVVRIEDEAFRGCTSLVDITLPEGICFVGEDVFYDTGYWNSFDKAVIYLGNVLLGYVGYSPETFISASMREGTRVVAGGAFENCTQIDQIIFPDTVVGIGANAYRNCTGVERIAISDSTLYIGEGAFYNCTALDSLTIPCSAQIGNNVFAGCSNLSTVNITAGTGTWENADGAWLPSDVSFAVKIEHGVTRIGNNAFNGCKGLTSIIIPSTVSSIGSNAFYDCERLTELSIPEGVTSIGDAAFSGCLRLETVNLPDGIEQLGDSLFAYCTSLSRVAIPESVRSIGEKAFMGCGSLESITIPDGITSISNRTFSDCVNLRELSLPDSVRYIGFSAFGNCRKLWNFELPDQLDSIYDCAFEECISITGLVIPQSTQYVGTNAFWGCTSLTEVSIPSSILIDSAAFMDCTSLSDIRIGEQVSVGISAFENTAYWNRQSDGLVYLDYILLGYKGKCTETSIIVAESTRSIAAGAFDSCSTLEEVCLPNGITSIRERTFSQCSGLTSIEIPESVEKIGSYAFYNCSGLLTVTFCGSEPEIREVARDAFLKCSSLTDVYYGGLEEQCRINDQYPYNTCETLLYCSWHYQTASAASGQCGDDLYWSFDEDTGILTITGSGDMDGYSWSTTPWIAYRAQITAVILPDGLTSIGSYAFSGCDRLSEIAIPDGVTNISDYAFFRCTGLTELTIPDSVTTIGIEALCGCEGLREITVLANNMAYSSVDGVLFNNDQTVLIVYPNGKNGTSYIIPDGVTNISDYAFFRCTGLTELTIPDSVTTIGIEAFCGCEGLTTLEIPDSVTSIDTAAFCDCRGLTNIKISNGLTVINCGVFDSCTNLPSITIPGSVTTVGNSAFGFCTSMTSVTIPVSVERIERGAFEECSALSDVYYGGTEAEKGMMDIDDMNEALLNAEWHCKQTSGQCGDNLYWSVDGGTLTITGSGEMWAFEQHDDVPWRAFEWISSIEFPDGLLNISNYSFVYLLGLHSVTIPDSVLRIGDYAFPECTEMHSLTLGNHVESIGRFAFDGCESLTEIVLPETLKSIGWGAFEVCKSLREITIPDGVMKIEPWTFNHCLAMETVTLPRSITEIGENAFLCDENITDVYYGGSLTQSKQISIADGNECLLNAIWHYTETSGQCGDGVYWGFDEDTGTLTISGTGEMDDVLGWEPLKDDIRRVVVGDGVTNILGSAFSECDNLVSAHIGRSVAEIGWNPFAWSRNLQEITVDPDNASFRITDGVLFSMDGTALYAYPPQRDGRSYVIPDGVTWIKGNAFCAAEKLTDITIPDSVTVIDGYSFASSGLHTVTVPASVRNVWGGAFANCTALNTIVIEGSETAFGYNNEAEDDGVFSNCCNVRSVTIPCSLTPYEFTFRGCYSLEELHLTVGTGEISTRMIEDLLFWYHYTEYTVWNEETQSWEEGEIPDAGPLSVILDEGITEIPDNTFDCNYFDEDDFDGNSAIASVTLPVSIRRIGANAFAHCGNLTDVYYGGSKAQAQENIVMIDGGNDSLLNATWHYHPASAASGQCGDNLYWSFDEDTGTLTITGSGDMDGYSWSTTPWIAYRAQITAVILPDALTSIGSSAFSDCDRLREITIPDSVTNIGDKAFYGCDELGSVTIGSGVTSIGEYAFGGMCSFGEITIPDNVTSIGNSVFEGNEGLTSVIIGNGVTSISACAFRDCAGLTSVTIGNGVTSIDHSAFCRCTYLREVTIPDSVKSIEYSAFEGCTGLRSVTIGNGVTSIGENAFLSCTGLTELTIPDSVTSIGNRAFEGCTGLRSVTIGNGITTISDGAFVRCTTLSEITFPDSVTSIGNSAFEGCMGLSEITIPDSVTSIDNYAFECCTGLRSVTIGSGVTSIGHSAFSYCSGLTSVTIPNNVKCIEYSTFAECTSLADVYYLGTEEQKEEIAIEEDNDLLLQATWHYIPIAFKSQALTLEGRIGVNFFIDLPQDEAIEYEGVSFTIDSIDGAETFVPFTGTSHPKNSSGYYQFTYYTRTIEMANTITATLRYTLNGKAGTLEKTYSVKQYFETFDQYISLFNEKQQNMVKATADLGHYVQAFLAAQKEWTFGTDYAEMDKHYADYTAADITAAQTALAPYAVNKSTGTNMQKITYSLVLDSDTELLVYFKPASGYTGTFTFTVNGTPIAENGEKISVALQSDGRYMVSIKNIAAHELGNEYVIKAMSDGDEASITVSALSYANAMITGYANNSEWANAAVAIYRYAAAAEAMRH